ncbi:MAG: Fe-S cluster protein [uncultured bacterium]|nr:MAG: Fe-S cluster protein [uncultured bacterium]HBG18312.1 Fe-S cluster protein [Desulfobulbaceae bacterium]
MVGANAMEIFLHLEKSNCRECGEKTCLAFAGAVFRGTRRIGECPRLNGAALAKFAADEESLQDRTVELAEYIAEMKGKLTRLDFAATAGLIGAKMSGETLQVPVLGKLFGVRGDGTFVTDLHLIPWVVVPLLEYIVNCPGTPVTGEWISFREIPGGREKYALFKKRGEDVLRELADRYTDFFDDIIHMFDGRAVDKQFEADVSVVLLPLPLVPMMICYWKPDEGMASSLNIFFDKSAGANIGVDSAFSLGTGIAQMLGKLATHHGF